MGMVLSTAFCKVHLGTDCFVHLNDLLNAEYHLSKKFILVDENTHANCLSIFREALSNQIHFEIIEIPSGEQYKNLSSCERIWQSLTNSGVDKDSVLISLGGGMIGDLGGFIAATILRGIDHIQVPTSLLAMVDASTGGKTGINFSGLKNQIGTFSHPKAVYINPEFTSTLSEREFNSGMAEIAKHALIADADMWQSFSGKSEFSSIELFQLIKRSVEIKNSFVLKDEKDTGERHALNFGHTIGHAIESYSLAHHKMPIRHGEAVAIGMMAESYLSGQILGLPTSQLHEILRSLESRFSYLQSDFLPAELMKYIYSDKKNKGTQPNFSLIPAIGSVRINQSASDLQIIESVKSALNHFMSTVQ